MLCPDPALLVTQHVFLDAEGPEINPPTQSRLDPGVRAEGPPDLAKAVRSPKVLQMNAFFKLWGHVSGQGVGRQILATAVRRPKVLQMNAFLSFGDTFLGGASAVRSWPKPSGAQKCSKLMLF